MEKDYKISPRYEVFNANMILDTNRDFYSEGLKACKPCQCHCRTCLGGMAPKIAEIICEKDAEKELELLLAA